MTLEEAVAAYLLVFPDASLKPDWCPGEGELVDSLSEASGFNGVDILIRARRTVCPNQPAPLPYWKRKEFNHDP